MNPFANGYNSPLTQVVESILRESNDVTKSDEFRAWFGDSKAVDEQGNPLALYHGTNAHAYSPGKEIEAFNTRPDSGRGAAYFTPDRALAASYGEKIYKTYHSMQNPLIVDVGHHGWGSIPATAKIIAGKVTPELRSHSAKHTSNMNKLFDEMAELFGDAGEPMKDPLDGIHDLAGLPLRTLPKHRDADTLETDQIAKTARDYGFDGVIFKNVNDAPTSDKHLYQQKSSDVYAAFHPNKIKSATHNNGKFSINSPYIKE